jgi:DNA helicase II / ATP-dependent DNA helicase PcrA
MPAITTPAFDEAYKKLNPAQKKAVDHIDGPVMVVAGPGTGKTQMLTLRIANILRQTDTAPSSILALTFTESGVSSMRKRLVDIIGSPGYTVYVSTFHGFCNDVIKRYPDAFPHIIGSQNATEIEQIQIMEDAINESELKYLKPYGDPFYYLRSAMSAIRELKREKISPEEYKKSIKEQEKDFKKIPDLYHEKGAHEGKMKGMYSELERKIAKNAELAVLYEAYQSKLKERKLYDYEDMILETIHALETNENLLLELQEQYQYILADEHQDANKSQNRLLELLASFHENPNVFVVGDEKQAIFRFQGASLENFLYFQKLYPRALIVMLEDNYRSTQTILDASHSLILKNESGADLRTKLQAKGQAEQSDKNTKTKIDLYEFSKAEYELRFLTHDIKKKLDVGINPNQIAIIYRDNRDALPLIRIFEKTTIPFVVESDQNILSDDNVAKFLLLLKAILKFGDNTYLAETLYIDFLGISHLDAFKLTAYSAKERVRLYDLIKHKDKLEDVGLDKPEAVHELYTKLHSWSSCSKNVALVECFERIVKESGFIDHLIGLPSSFDACAKLDALFSEAKKLAENKKDAKLVDFLRYLSTLETYNVLIKNTGGNHGRSGIRLMTAHKSKGLEFEYVYVVGAYDTHWGNKRDIKHFHLPKKGLDSYTGNSLEDERRLFYVALTRAKRQVTISFSKVGHNGENQLPAQFVEELDPQLVQHHESKDIEEGFSKDGGAGYIPRQSRGASVKDREFLSELFLSQGLSVTALNTYLKCPWDYFFGNLLRIPRAETKHQLYGTAIHDTLKFFFEAYKEKKEMKSADVIHLFKNNLRRKPLSDQDYKASLEKGKRALEGYLKKYKSSWHRNILTEFKITGVHIGDSMLRGILDKVEIGNDNRVNVVDYKTAEPKSRNDIMGNTKSSDGNYYRQLVFYKLLLKHFEKGKYVMDSGEIDFVEPDKKGNYHKERFEISDEDVEKLETVIKRVSQEILNLSFWDTDCNDKECDFCRLRKLIKS